MKNTIMLFLQNFRIKRPSGIMMDGLSCMNKMINNKAVITFLTNYSFGVVTVTPCSLNTFWTTFNALSTLGNPTYGIK